MILLFFKGLLAKHRLKRSQDLLLVFLAKHVRKLGHLFALFGAADELFAHDGEPNLVIVRLQVPLNHSLQRIFEVEQERVFAEFGPAELVGADGLLAEDLMARQMLQVEGLRADAALDHVRT